MKLRTTSYHPIRRNVRGAFPMVLLAFIPLGIALLAGHFGEDRRAAERAAEQPDYRRSDMMRQQAFDTLMRLKSEARAREDQQRREAEAAARARGPLKLPEQPPVAHTPHPYLDRQPAAPARPPVAHTPHPYLDRQPAAPARPPVAHTPHPYLDRQPAAAVQPPRQTQPAVPGMGEVALLGVR